MILSKHDEDVLREKAEELRREYPDDVELNLRADQLVSAADSGDMVQAAYAAGNLIRDLQVRRFLNG